MVGSLLTRANKTVFEPIPLRLIHNLSPAHSRASENPGPLAPVSVRCSWVPAFGALCESLERNRIIESQNENQPESCEEHGSRFERFRRGIRKRGPRATTRVRASGPGFPLARE